MSKLDLVKQLRLLTQAGINDCYEALRESNNDLDKAVDIIKTKGQNILSNIDGKETSEGLVLVKSVSPKSVAMIEVNCQTDFVARNPDFKKFAEDVLDYFINNKDLNLNDPNVVNMRTNIISKTKENCTVNRWKLFESLDNQQTFSYVHSDNKLATMLTIQVSNTNLLDSEELKSLGDNLCMQVASMNPLSLSIESLSSNVIERQKNIFEEQVKELNKAPLASSKIVKGKLNKWYKEVCLLEQDLVFDTKIVVKDFIKNISNKLNCNINVVDFVRFKI